MLDIILNIICVLLIILGILLGIVMLLLGIILLTPIRYSSKGSYIEKFQCDFRISWLFKLIQFVGSFDENGLVWKIKLSFFKVFDQDDLKRYLEKAEEKPQGKPPEEKKQDKKDEKSETESLKTPEESQKESETDIENKASGEAEHITDKEVPTEKVTQKKNIFDKIKEKYNNIIFKVKDIKVKAKKFFANLKRILLKADELREFLSREEVKKELKVVGRQILKVLNHIKPKVLKGRLLIGTGEPDKTGMLIGAMCIFYGLYGEEFLVTADFENKVFEGEYFLKGSFNLLLFVIVIFRLLCQKNLVKYIINFRL